MLTRAPSVDSDYYAITVLGQGDDKITWGCFSGWEGFVDVDRIIELRSASIVRAARVREIWRDAGQSCAVVDNLADLEVFFLLGGNALIEAELANEAISDWLAPHPVVPSGPRGFVHVESLPKDAFNRAPSPKTRMRVLKRDGFRCKICGRSATDYVDVELHVHHIRPWAQGGTTDERNLITLCHTCHKGLDPHFEPSLFALLKEVGKHDGASEDLEYWESVALYRELVVQEFFDGSDGPDQ